MTDDLTGDRRGYPLPRPVAAEGDPLRCPHQASCEYQGSHSIRVFISDVQNISTTTGSKDMQMVSLTLRVMSRPDINHLPTIYQNLGLE
jgi:hypothetical protein